MLVALNSLGEIRLQTRFSNLLLQSVLFSYFFEIVSTGLLVN